MRMLKTASRKAFWSDGTVQYLDMLVAVPGHMQKCISCTLKVVTFILKTL